MGDDELRARVDAWIEADPDPTTREELRQLLLRESYDELADRFAGDLDFGTAGLRGRVEAGPDRMNLAVVTRASRGLGDHLVATHGGGLVVVAHDARPDSERFADTTARVLAAAGLDVTWFREPTPTPVAAYWTRRTGAVAGVVVTASHNPPADNGYKVFGPGGVQITSPTDAAVRAAIDRVGRAVDVPTADVGVVSVPDPLHVQREYLAALALARPDVGPRTDVDIVVTPMHGVGGAAVERALRTAGHAVVRVAEQWEPDGGFPTVAFPNPEEPGALDLAFDVATQHDADVVLALDPDADRLAVGIPTVDGWRRLSGDELGCVLADHLLGHHRGPTPVVANSIVSSARLARVAARHGADVETTLTGFKWIWRALAARAEAGDAPVLGYEEAIGYSVGDVVRDKDGIGAAVVVADLVAALAAEGRTLGDALAALDAAVGRWEHRQTSVRLSGADADERKAALMAAARRPPATVADTAVARTDDLLDAADRRPPWLPADDVVVWHLDGGGRVLVRPSGTEPKVKLYVDHPTDDPTHADRVMTAARHHLDP